MGLAQKLVDGVLIMKLITFFKSLLFFSLFVLEACDPPDIDHAYDYLCYSNFRCTAFVPEQDSVWLELYSGDSLIDRDTLEDYYSSLPNSELEFRERLVLRIHVFCNGEWLDDIDFEFENRTDKYTRIELYYVDGWRRGSTVTRIFTDEQLAKCPELSEYRIYVNTEHPPDCPQFHQSANNGNV